MAIVKEIKYIVRKDDLLTQSFVDQLIEQLQQGSKITMEPHKEFNQSQIKIEED